MFNQALKTLTLMTVLLTFSLAASDQAYGKGWGDWFGFGKVTKSWVKTWVKKYHNKHPAEKGDKGDPGIPPEEVAALQNQVAELTALMQKSEEQRVILNQVHTYSPKCDTASVNACKLDGFYFFECSDGVCSSPDDRAVCWVGCRNESGTLFNGQVSTDDASKGSCEATFTGTTPATIELTSCQ